MQRIALIAALSGAFLAACAQTDAPPPANSASYNDRINAAVEDDPDVRVCEMREVPGSIIPKKVCMTRAEKEAQRKQAADSVGESQRNALRTCTAGAGCGGG